MRPNRTCASCGATERGRRCRRGGSDAPSYLALSLFARLGVDMAYADVEVVPHPTKMAGALAFRQLASGTHLQSRPRFIEALPVSAMRSPKFRHLAVPVPASLRTCNHLRSVHRACRWNRRTPIPRPTLYRFSDMLARTQLGLRGLHSILLL